MGFWHHDAIVFSLHIVKPGKDSITHFIISHAFINCTITNICTYKKKERGQVMDTFTASRGGGSPFTLYHLFHTDTCEHILV